MRLWLLAGALSVAASLGAAQTSFVDALATEEPVIEVYRACRGAEASFDHLRAALEGIGWAEERSQDAFDYVRVQALHIGWRARLSRFSYPNRFTEIEGTDTLSLIREELAAFPRPSIELRGDLDGQYSFGTAFGPRDEPPQLAVEVTNAAGRRFLNCTMIGSQAENPRLTAAFFDRWQTQPGRGAEVNRWLVSDGEFVDQAGFLTPHAQQTFPLLPVEFDLFLVIGDVVEQQPASAPAP